MALLEATCFYPMGCTNQGNSGGMSIGNSVHRSIAGVTNGFAQAVSTTGGVFIGGSFRADTAALPSGTYVLGRAVNYNPTVSWQRCLSVSGVTGTLRFIIGFDGATRRWYIADSTGSPTTYTTTIQPNVSAYQWQYLEVKWTIGSGTTTTITVKLDGTTILSAVSTGVVDATDMSRWDTYVTSGDGGQNWTITDQYLLDNTGSVNNDFLGDCRVECLTASSAGTNQQSTPSSGTRLAAIQTSGGATVNIDSTQVDTFVMTDLGSSLGTVKGVACAVLASKGGGAVFAVGEVRIGSTTYASPTINRLVPSATARTTYGIFEVSPATAGAFTASEVNAMEAGYSVAATGNAA